MHLYVFGNGNLVFSDFLKYYYEPLSTLAHDSDVHFLVCDFRGVDTMAMECLKSLTPNVHVYHVGDRPRYLPDTYQTRVSQWQLVGGFVEDADRDAAAISVCTHFLAYDFNSNASRKSGTLRNIEQCLTLEKCNLAGKTGEEIAKFRG